ncbi:Transposon Tf2-1 polyprotein [Rhizoctonia solani AG-3 Rhs1AP]|uniref:Transposon Tf2-1 polyprotein n=1 Tax=Rhizoctonia solani AG-3 Rhs1AP TaxID=1086054 RepID=A0A0A1UIH2_9AGAM|nr:Transposon Tf2-1 polyprotein [Rhizoctonia solani AG-3 Rhs1AP]
MTKGKPEEPPINFEVGERAWLDAKNINLKTTSSKLNDRRLGPFKVIEKISDLAYRLELPESMKVHNVFYLGLTLKSQRKSQSPIPGKATSSHNRRRRRIRGRSHSRPQKRRRTNVLQDQMERIWARKQHMGAQRKPRKCRKFSEKVSFNALEKGP